MGFAAEAQHSTIEMGYRVALNEYRIGHRHMTTVYTKHDGYIVFKGDTLHGIVQLSKTTLYFEQYQPHDQVKPYEIKLKNPDLQTIMVYNYDNKALCITKVQHDDKKMRRVIHKGKLNIYDDWMKYIYNPSDIDPYLLVVEYDGVVDELGTFTKGTMMRDLVAYVNDIYGLKLDARTMTWSKLMRQIDELD